MAADAIELQVGQRTVRISSPDRVYFPARGETKLDLARYYQSVGDGIVRALRDRPCMLHRFPAGVAGEKVHQKRVPAGAPPWLETVRVHFPRYDRHADELCVTELASVIWAVQMSTVEFHPWNSRRANTEQPDEWRIDLDPMPECGFGTVRRVAGVVREILDELQITGWPKTSGGNGLHVYVRIESRWGFGEVRRAALAFAREVERRIPDEATTTWWRKDRDPTKLFVDFNQNARDHTIACAYSVRGVPEGTVSAPITWDEVADAEPGDFTIATMPERYARLGDLHEYIDDVAYSLDTLLEWADRDGLEPRTPPRWPAAQFPARPVSVLVRATGWEDEAVTTDLIGQARAGDQEAFRQLLEPYRRELHVHCYRFLGSVQDAEDVLQETLLSAWQALPGFEGRSSLRTWLYRIATSRCLNALRAQSRRPRAADAAAVSTPPGVNTPAPSGTGEISWLEPYPDLLLDEMPDEDPGPEAQYESHEAISLAFVTALQILPPRQRAALILRDVLGFRAREVASMIDASEESVTSALKRARTALQSRVGAPGEGSGGRSGIESGARPAPELGSAREQELVDRLTAAFESGEVADIVALLTDDVRLSMPPLVLEYHGRDLARRFFHAVHRGRRYRSVHTRANRQPALAFYIRDPQADLWHANGLVVVTLAADGISGITRFDSGVFPSFGLPRTLPD